MALIKCEECKKKFSDTLDACPHCGFKLVKEENNKIYSYVNIDEFAYDYAKDTGLLDFPRYNSDFWQKKESYLEFEKNAYGGEMMYGLAAAVNTMSEVKKYNYDGLKLLIPFIDQAFKGYFCLGICEDKVIYFHTKKIGIRIVESLRQTLDVDVYSFSNIELDARPDESGNITMAFLNIDGKHKFTIQGYDPILLHYYSYCVEKINNKDYDLEYKKGDIKEKIFSEEQTANAPKGGGCYVATCVYGSYDCPQVWVLRRYRDQNLASSWYGRLFIHTYYSISPIIVKLFGKTEWFKNICKPKLDRMVKNLLDEGYDSTPYIDKKW